MDERTPPLQPAVAVDSIAPTGLDQGDGPPGASSGAINLHRLEPLIPVVSARILNASSDTLDEVIRHALQEILQSLGLGRGGLLKVEKGRCHVLLSYDWHIASIRF